MPTAASAGFSLPIPRSITDLIYYAADGAIASTPTGDMLLMQNGEVQRRDVSDGTVSIIKFNSYAFDLSQFASAGDDFVIYAKDRPLSYLLNPDPNDPVLQTRPLRYKAELHRRLTQWLYPVVFAMIALAFAGDSVRIAKRVSRHPSRQSAPPFSSIGQATSHRIGQTRMQAISSSCISCLLPSFS